MVAATSTASILASALTYPNPDNTTEPKYSAIDVINLYEEYGASIYYEREISTGMMIVIIIFATFNGFEIGIQISNKMYKNKKVNEAIQLI